MSLDLSQSRAQELTAKLAPYALHVLHRTAEHALNLFADEVVPEHLLTTIMADDDCAAYHAVIFAFADPQTLGREALALSPGILVVSSSHSLPFSPHGVAALFRAREHAHEQGASEVSPAHLMGSAFDELKEKLQSKLRETGFDRDALARADEAQPAESHSEISLEEALFASFSEESRRVLGVACKLSKQNQREAISPAHILGACVQRHPELASRAKIHAMKISSTIGRGDADESSPEPRAIPLDGAMLDFLEAFTAKAIGLSTLDLLDGFCRHGSTEVLDILKHNRITSELIGRVAESYRDPESAEG